VEGFRGEGLAQDEPGSRVVHFEGTATAQGDRASGLAAQRTTFSTVAIIALWLHCF